MMRQVLILPLILFLLPAAALSQGSWIELQSPTNAFLRKCVFTDTLNGWAIGDSGIIIRTSNGGDNWQIQSSNNAHFLRDVFFLDKNNGWAAAWFSDFSPGTLLYKTTNGGVSWNTALYPDTNLYIERIYFTSSMKGYFGTAFPAGIIYYTTNGGAGWLPSQLDSTAHSSYPVRGMRFLNASTGFALGGFFDIAGVVWRTTDAGLSWTAQNVGPEPINDILFKDDLNHITVGGDFEFGPSVSRTSNSGINWQYQTLKKFGIAYSIDMQNINEYWIALGYAGNFLYSSNAGGEWNSIPMPNGRYIYSIDFVNERNGWGVGDHGAIVKFVPEPSGIINTGNTIPEGFKLHQNYPNPFNPVTKIAFDIPENSDFIELAVYNSLGQEMSKTVKNNLPAGNYEYSFDGNTFQSGVYFYRLTVGGSFKQYSEIKKMILVK